MKVLSRIEGVDDFEAEHSEWVVKALTRAQSLLGWGSIETALECLASESGAVGANDDYNLACHARAEYVSYGDENDDGRIGWVIIGGCGYGSKIRVRGNSFRIDSCGGHFVAGEWDTYGSVKWDADAVPSEASWADADNGLQGSVLVAARVARLQKVVI